MSASWSFGALDMKGECTIDERFRVTARFDREGDARVLFVTSSVTQHTFDGRVVFVQPDVHPTIGRDSHRLRER